jgi:hypothetical protein
MGVSRQPAEKPVPSTFPLWIATVFNENGKDAILSLAGFSSGAGCERLFRFLTLRKAEKG